MAGLVTGVKLFLLAGCRCMASKRIIIKSASAFRGVTIRRFLAAHVLFIDDVGWRRGGGSYRRRRFSMVSFAGSALCFLNRLGILTWGEIVGGILLLNASALLRVLNDNSLI